MAATLIEKIIATHSEQETVKPGDIVDLRLDARVARDFGGANVVANLRRADLDIADPQRTFFTFDCNPGGSDQKYATNQQLCRMFAREYGVQVYDIDSGIGTHVAIDEGLAVGIRRVGDLWEEGEFFLPELMQGAEIMKAAMDLLHPLILESEGEGVSSLGRVVIGTVEGDIHDIGKTLVGAMLTANGFEVFDLGADVPVSRFVAEAEEKEARLICLSALLTTTMLSMKDAIEAIKAAGLRDQVKIMIGGAPIRQEFADEVGADFYGPDSTSGRNFARDVVTKEA